MSARAEQWVEAQADALCLPTPCQRWSVLEALAKRHEDGPLTLPTQTLADDLGCHPVHLWGPLWALHWLRLIHASNIGGLMTVTFAFDFPDVTTAHSSASPQPEEAAE